MEQGLGRHSELYPGGGSFELRECTIRLGVTGFDPSVYQVGRDGAVLLNQARRLVEFFPHLHPRDVSFFLGSMSNNQGEGGLHWVKCLAWSQCAIYSRNWHLNLSSLLPVGHNRRWVSRLNFTSGDGRQNYYQRLHRILDSCPHDGINAKIRR